MVVFSVVIGTPLVKVTLELELAPDSGLPNVALTALANVMVMAIVMAQVTAKCLLPSAFCYRSDE